MITNDKIVKKAKKIKLVITDIDGVWTDAKCIILRMALS